jgi:hypothetical protein
MARLLQPFSTLASRIQSEYPYLAFASDTDTGVFSTSRPSTRKSTVQDFPDNPGHNTVYDELRACDYDNLVDELVHRVNRRCLFGLDVPDTQSTQNFELRSMWTFMYDGDIEPVLTRIGEGLKTIQPKLPNRYYLVELASFSRFDNGDSVQGLGIAMRLTQPHYLYTDREILSNQLDHDALEARALFLRNIGSTKLNLYVEWFPIIIPHRVIVFDTSKRRHFARNMHVDLSYMRNLRPYLLRASESATHRTTVMTNDRVWDRDLKDVLGSTEEDQGHHVIFAGNRPNELVFCSTCAIAVFDLPPMSFEDQVARVRQYLVELAFTMEFGRTSIAYPEQTYARVPTKELALAAFALWPTGRVNVNIQARFSTFFRWRGVLHPVSQFDDAVPSPLAGLITDYGNGFKLGTLRLKSLKLTTVVDDCIEFEADAVELDEAWEYNPVLEDPVDNPLPTIDIKPFREWKEETPVVVSVPEEPARPIEGMPADVAQAMNMADDAFNEQQRARMRIEIERERALGHGGANRRRRLPMNEVDEEVE